MTLLHLLTSLNVAFLSLSKLVIVLHKLCELYGGCRSVLLRIFYVSFRLMLEEEGGSKNGYNSAKKNKVIKGIFLLRQGESKWNDAL